VPSDTLVAQVSRETQGMDTDGENPRSQSGGSHLTLLFFGFPLEIDGMERTGFEPVTSGLQSGPPIRAESRSRPHG
jgi:hypothetical protein